MTLDFGREVAGFINIVPALRKSGVDYLQGWGVGMPRALDEVFDELANVET